MTRSARASTFGGIVNPICLAAFRLMTNSNFVGCSTGRSAGLRAFQNLVHIRGRAPVQVEKAHAVEDKSPGFYKLDVVVYGGDPVLYGKVCKLYSLRTEDRAR